MSVANREAPYVLDGPLRHGIEFSISTHHTDTGGGEATRVGAATRSSKLLATTCG
jgi:hypothetical protein